MTTAVRDGESCSRAVVSKGQGLDQPFFYGVITTGVYCRPSCPARLPRRENVRFFSSCGEAESAGFRACLRCHPASATSDEANRVRIRGLCEYIRENCRSGDPLTLAHLSKQAGLSVFHLQRTFKALVGVTPRQYAEACRTEALKESLRSKESVTAAIYEAGFGSSSSVYGQVDGRLGMTPREYRAGGKGVVISYVSAPSPLGVMTLGATDRGLCFLEFGNSEEDVAQRLRKEYPRAMLEEMRKPYPQEFDCWMESLGRYLRREQATLELPLDVQGTVFQKKVWKYLQSIPSGEVQSYAEVAACVGTPKATRAVASACARNKVAMVIPCHRVIRGDGGLGGYRWGLDRKRSLIENEREMRLSADVNCG